MAVQSNIPIGAGLGQEYALTGIKRKPAYSSIIGAQASYLPQLYALKEEGKQREKEYALAERALGEETALARDRIAAIERLGKEELDVNKELASERMALDKALSNYETAHRELISQRQYEQQRREARASNIIGVGQVATQGLLGYSQLKGLGQNLGFFGAGGGAAGTGGLPGAATGLADIGGVATETATLGGESSLFGAVSPYLGPASAGFGAGTLMSSLIGEKGTKGAIMGAGAGTIAGAAIGSAIPGVGTAIGAIIGGITGGGGGGLCCFIFIASHGYLHPVVREYRNMKMTVRNRRGYYWLADKLVPLMKKSKFVNKLVEYGMVRPMTHYGKYYFGLNKSGAIFAGLTAFWLKTFDLLGMRPPYNRKGTNEVV